MSAEAYLPDGSRSVGALRAAAERCEGCDLHQRATQTVFGEGRVRSPLLMLVGEQPGDIEDRTGRPFVGPAGKLLNEALDAVAIDRRSIYVTNAVKHFKWEGRGKLRLHKSPSAREVAACRPWLLAETEPSAPKYCSVLERQPRSLCSDRHSGSRSSGARFSVDPMDNSSSRRCTPHRSSASVMRKSGGKPSTTSWMIFAPQLPPSLTRSVRSTINLHGSFRCTYARHQCVQSMNASCSIHEANHDQY